MKTTKRLLSLIPMAFLALAVTVTSCEDSDSDSDKDTTTKEYSYSLVASGQTTLYDHDGAILTSISEGEAFYGQDASYLKGKTMMYIDNADSTISDENTGLMWEEIPIPDGLTWDEAVLYCENLKLAGYDDWRMPSLKELFSISDFGRGWPYIDTTYFKLASGIVDKSEQFWSSNKYVGSTVEGGYNAAFGVNHVTGHIKAYPASASIGADGENDMQGPPSSDGGPEGTDTGSTDATGTMPAPITDDNSATSFNPLTKHVRAVRGNTYGENEFTDNENGTISDAATGLMWSQDDEGEQLNWEDALTYAENSTLAGYTDWRLPNVKELQAIIDYSYAPGAIDASLDRAAIDPMFSCTQITNEAGDDDYGYYWTGTSANFTSGDPYYYAWYIALGRAVNGEGLDYHGAGAVRFDTKYEGGPLGEGGERYYNFVFLVRDLD